MIEITQTCDGCGESRDLSVNAVKGYQEIEQAAKVGGWREVVQDKWLCIKCIKTVLSQK